MSKREIWVSILVCTWFVLASAIVFWISIAKRAHFDPELMLSQAITSLSFEDELQQTLNAYFTPGENAQGQILHVVQGNCYCEWLARPHQQKIDKWAKENAFNSHSISLDEIPSLSSFIPSTPAVIVTDNIGNIIYLGPYSRGSGCFSKNGEIDAFLQRWVSFSEIQKAQQKIIVDTEASGCYCSAN